MIVRNAVVLGSIFFASLAVGCGAPPDGIGKDGKGVTGGGSPNDPGWQPPGANNGNNQDDGNPQPGDDQGEQPTHPPTCSVPLPPIPEGWMTHAMIDFSVAAPPDWKVDYSYDKVPPGDRSAIELESGAIAYLASAVEYADIHTFDAFMTLVKVVAAGKNGDSGCIVASQPLKFGCDDALSFSVTCPQRSTLPGVAMAVLHGGVVYEVGCSATGGASLDPCAEFVGSLRFTK